MYRGVDALGPVAVMRAEDQIVTGLSNMNPWKGKNDMMLLSSRDPYVPPAEGKELLPSIFVPLETSTSLVNRCPPLPSDSRHYVEYGDVARASCSRLVPTSSRFPGLSGLNLASNPEGARVRDHHDPIEA